MTMQLKDLFESFTDKSIEDQFKKISEVRDTRSIERPAVAKKRRKKEAATSERKKDKVKELLLRLTPEERAAMIEKLRGE